MTFEQWKSEVNAKLIHFVGIPCDFFPDWGYWDAWNDGVTAHEAAIDVMTENGFMEQAGWDDEEHKNAR